MPSPLRQALITGASGYLGGKLAEQLAAEGWRVHALVRPSSETQRLRKLGDEVQIHPYTGTPGELMALVGSVSPDATFHLASHYLAEHTPDDLGPMIRGNILLGTELAEALSIAQCNCLVNVGTGLQHWHSPDYSPGNLYAATKQAMEDILDYYALARGLRIITLTIFDTYGPDDPRRKLLTLLRQASLDGRTLAMSPGEQLIDLLHVDDAIQALVTASKRLLQREGYGHERYSLATGTLVSLRELVELYQRQTGRSVKVDWGARPYRKQEVMCPWRAGLRLPGWKPRIALADGLRELADASSLKDLSQSET